MSREIGRSSGGGDAGALPVALAECAELAERLSRTPRAERDLAWHVKAGYVGDLTALVAARLRALDAEACAGSWDRPRAARDLAGWRHPHEHERRWLPRRR
ncbi:MAG TPA: hypothetical protein VKV21_09120 [Solirubrobacteraceae bacterium]|nr:hypothetical protein [Solirubrobacteraceae bacterium]